MRFRSNSAVKFTRKRVGKAKDGRTVSAVTCILGTSKLKELNLRAGHFFFFFFDVVHRITMQSQLLWLLTVSVFLLILMSLTAPAARKKTGSSECVRSMYKNMPGKLRLPVSLKSSQTMQQVFRNARRISVNVLMIVQDQKSMFKIIQLSG